MNKLLEAKPEVLLRPGRWWNQTWGLVEGCSPVSRGCDSCWARSMLRRFGGEEAASTVRVFPERLGQPLHWRKPRRVFVAPRGDLFHEEVPTEFIAKVWMRMLECDQHTFLLLTKRPERAQRELRALTYLELALPNVHLGVSIEDQATAEERIPVLLATPAASRFVSCEPLLEAVDLTWHHWCAPLIHHLQWIVAGPETGPGRRPAPHDWFRRLRDDCQAAGVPYWLKALSENEDGSGRIIQRPKLDGMVWEQLP